MTNPFPEYGTDPIPDYDSGDIPSSEKVFSADEFHPTRTVKPSKVKKTPLPLSEIIKPASALLRPKEEPSAPPVQSVPEPLPEKPVISRKPGSGRKPTGKALSNAERQRKWRAANLEVARARQREAMKKIRESK